MASIFDDLPTNPNQLAGTDLAFYDADTLYDPEGKGYRLQGVNALEVDTLGKEGEIGGDLTTEQAVRLANDLGYTNVVKTGEMDVTGKREIIDLRDDQGRSFRRELAASGLAKPMAGYDPSGDLSQSARFRRAMRTTNQYENNEFDKAADILEQHMDEEGANTLRFKQKRLMPGMNADFISRGAGATFEFDGIDTETGKSTGSWGTAWATSMNGVADAAFGIADMVGDRVGINALEKYGEAGSERARERISREGKILLDYQDVNSFGTAVDYLTNNLVMSLPYMGITAASALAAPVTGGASLLAPVSIYTGQTWNEMGDQIEGTDKERSAGIAIASGLVQAALDLVGLKLVVGTSGVPKDVFKKGVEALVANGFSEKQAVDYLATQTKRGIAELSGDAAGIAREQLDSMRLVTTTLGRAGEGALSEGVTEAMQESIAAIAADIGSDSAIDWKDVKERAIAGAVAGAALGGGISAAGSIKDAGTWADIAYNISPFNSEDESVAGQYAKEEEARQGYVPTNQENLAAVDNLADPVEQVQDRKARHEERLKKRTVNETVADMMTNIPALWRGAVRHIFTEDLQARSRTARIMADLFNGRNTKIFGGAHYENRMHHHMTESKNSVMSPEEFFVNMNEGKHVFSGQNITLSQKFYEEVEKGFDNNKNFNPNLIPDSPTKATTVALAKQLLELGNKLHKDQEIHNKDLGYINSYLLRFRTLNKKAVKKHRNHFISKLKEHYNLDDATAVSLTDQILNGESATVGEAFSVVKGGPHPDSHKARKFNLSEKKDKDGNLVFNQFMEQDVFENVSQAARSAARYVAYQEFVGDNASKIGKMLDQMQREGLSEEEVDRIAYQMTNYLDAQSGNYKRPTSEFGKSLQAIQKNFMLFVTITSLPLAALSSLPELAMITRGLTYDQIFGKKGQPGSLNAMGKELANTLYNGMMEVARLSYSVAPSIAEKLPGIVPTDDTIGTGLLRYSGYYEWDVGAAATTGVTETHAWHNKLLEKFFKWTGLAGLTNFTRASRAAIFGDFFVDNASIILNHDPSTPETNEVRIAKEKLRNLGFDVSRNLQELVDVMNQGIDKIDPNLDARLAEQVREGLFNFINEAVAMPQSANRPLMYQDPRLALFMQFQGFMATFTANHIPRMWDEYIKRGSPAMKYHTFAMMTSMIMLGFASQYLKDLVKFGESSPYLDEAELIQRGILASGLMGTPERVFNQFFPLYETRTDGPVDWVFNTASGESPTVGKIATLGSALGKGVTGDLEGSAKDVGRATLGPFYQPVKWAFNGE